MTKEAIAETHGPDDVETVDPDKVVEVFRPQWGNFHGIFIKLEVGEVFEDETSNAYLIFGHDDFPQSVIPVEILGSVNRAKKLPFQFGDDPLFEVGDMDYEYREGLIDENRVLVANIPTLDGTFFLPPMFKDQPDDQPAD